LNLKQLRNKRINDLILFQTQVKKEIQHLLTENEEILFIIEKSKYGIILRSHLVKNIF